MILNFFFKKKNSYHQQSLNRQVGKHVNLSMKHRAMEVMCIKDI